MITDARLEAMADALVAVPGVRAVALGGDGRARLAVGSALPAVGSRLGGRAAVGAASYHHHVTLDDLRDRVEQLYQATEPAVWADPHPDREPTDDEYSQLTDPERYGISHRRTLAWLRACVELLGASVPPGLPDDLTEVREQRLTLASPRPGTLPIVVDLKVTELPWVSFGVQGSEPMESAPGCGCDACDDGSAGVLVEVDRWFDQVLGGELVWLQGGPASMPASRSPPRAAGRAAPCPSR